MPFVQRKNRPTVIDYSHLILHSGYIVSMNRQKKIRQKLLKKAKAANVKASPKQASTYIAKADRESTVENATSATTSPSHPATDHT
jgi:hypothetical protein